MDLLRGEGHSFSNQTFYRAWGETESHLASAENIVDAPLNRIPAPDQVGMATRPRARGHLYNVELAVHDPQTGEVAFHSWGIKSNKLISIGSALRMAVDSWVESQQRGRNSPEGRALGGYVSSALKLVGPEDE